MTKLSIDQAYEQVKKALFELRCAAYAEGHADGKFDAEMMAQQRRDEIVEKAKEDVEELLSRNYTLNSTPKITTHGKTIWFSDSVGHLVTDKCDFVVNKEKRTVVALIKELMDNELIHKGIAKCAPSDCFNAHIGKAIALRRALGSDVPSEYHNAPQPTDVRVGDVVEVNWAYGSGTIKKRLNVVEMGKFSSGKNCVIGSVFSENGKIIDDSRDEVSE